MATLILTIGGGIAGSFIGMPWLGAALGGMVGGYVDRTIDPFGLQPDPVHIEGPRLDTLKAQSGSYGQQIDRFWGRAVRKAGNLIWALDLEEVATTEEQGGKGSPPKSSSTRYTYYGHFAVSFGYGRPSVQLVKLWCDGKLCYVNSNIRTYSADTTCEATIQPRIPPDDSGLIQLVKTAGNWSDVGVSAPMQITISGFSSSEKNGTWQVVGCYGSLVEMNSRGDGATITPETATISILSSSYTDSATVDWPAGSDDFEQYFTFHPGSIDQAADATIQASVGASSTPAYREQCYISFDRLPLANFGNRIPNITAQLSYETPIITVLEDLCTLAGLDAEDQDFTAVAQLGEMGGVIVGRSDSREAIRQIAQAYSFDFIESEGKIKAVPNKTAPDLTVPSSHLGAAAEGEKARAMTRSFDRSRSLPRQISLSYVSSAMDFDPATVTFRREGVMSCVRKEINLPLTLTPDEARALTDTLGRKAWIERTGYTFTLPRKYVAVEPADLITLPTEYGSPVVKVTSVRLSPRGIVGVEAVRAAVFTLPAASTDAGPGGFTPIPDADWHASQLVLMDIPILRDADDDAGVYAVAYTWKDTQEAVYRASDSTSFSSYAILSKGAIVADCSSALADCINPDLWDRKNTLTVTLRTTLHTLESKSETQVLDGENVALVGSEIIQFQTASLTTTSVYTLSNLLRGRRGTEQHTGSHAAGETFVLLREADITRISTAVSEYGSTYQYKGVGSGETVLTVPMQGLAKQCAGLKPYSPVHVVGQASTAGDWAFSWKRRGRVNAGWNSLSDIPADSTLAESYEIDVMTNTTSTAIKRTLGSTSTSVIYTVAQQTSDFGGSATAVTINVYQLGPLGRGFGKKETLP